MKIDFEIKAGSKLFVRLRVRLLGALFKAICKAF